MKDGMGEGRRQQELYWKATQSQNSRLKEKFFSQVWVSFL